MTALSGLKNIAMVITTHGNRKTLNQLRIVRLDCFMLILSIFPAEQQTMDVNTPRAHPPNEGKIPINADVQQTEFKSPHDVHRHPRIRPNR
jgi:hypothetical protein